MVSANVGRQVARVAKPPASFNSPCVTPLAKRARLSDGNFIGLPQTSSSLVVSAGNFDDVRQESLDTSSESVVSGNGLLVTERDVQGRVPVLRHYAPSLIRGVRIDSADSVDLMQAPPFPL